MLIVPLFVSVTEASPAVAFANWRIALDTEAEADAPVTPLASASRVTLIEPLLSSVIVASPPPVASADWTTP